MKSNLKSLEQQIEKLIISSEKDFSENKMDKLKPEVEQINSQLDQIQQDQSLTKKEKGRVCLLKGKSLDLLPEYSKQAEENLSKALKLDPLDQDCWNTLGHILWKKQDYEGAKKMFEGAIEQCGKNKKSIRYLSIVMRCIGQGDVRNKNVEKSVELAKEAVSLDFKDGESWYIVGNAYLSNFFVNMKTIEELNLALKAYQQAEKHLDEENPDLFFNRASIFQYLEDYQKAIDQYNKAQELDSTLQSQDKIAFIRQKFERIYDLVENRGRIKQKRLQNMVKTIPTALKNTPRDSNYIISPFDTLKEGINKGCILTCKITNNVSAKGEVPATFVFTDHQQSFGALSIYNTSDEIYGQIKENADIFIVDPLVKKIALKGQEGEIQYRCIQILDINKIYVDSEQVTASFSPSVVVNQTFQNKVEESKQK